MVYRKSPWGRIGKTPKEGKVQPEVLELAKMFSKGWRVHSFFLKIDLRWSIIASQYCVSFCCTTNRISHMHTHVPISPLSWASLPSSLSHPSRSSQSTELISLCYAAASRKQTILHSVVSRCRCYSHFAPASPSHPMSSSPFSMSTSFIFSFFKKHLYWSIIA